MYVKISGDGLKDIKEAITFLKSNRVLVGIPSASAGGRGEGMTNVDLAFIHSNGSPKHHIPARPFLEPAIAEATDSIAGRMKEAAIKAIDGDTGAAMNELHKAGMYGENAAKDYIGSGNHAPNAPITIAGGWMRNHVSHKPFKVEGKGSSTPLIDTGSLRSSITHVIEGK